MNNKILAIIILLSANQCTTILSFSRAASLGSKYLRKATRYNNQSYRQKAKNNALLAQYAQLEAQKYVLKIYADMRKKYNYPNTNPRYKG